MKAAPAHYHFRSNTGDHLLIVPFSRIYDMPEEFAARLSAEDPDALALTAALALPGPEDVPLDGISTPAPHSLSLNVSSSCNLGCSYCYASRGQFDGAQSAPMSWGTAKNAIDRLLATPDSGAPLTLGFLGGEPFVNRPLIHRAVSYAAASAKAQRRSLGFSVTTNGTLLKQEDIALLQSHRFAVTISIDGGEATHNAQRPGAKGRASFARLAHAIAPLLENPGLARIAARATVLPHDLNLTTRFDDILDLGFKEVGFSPLKSAPAGGAFADAHWPPYLNSLMSLARCELKRALAGEELRLSNFAIALKQLHRGAASPYPCGAGGGYFSVAADGDWFACHRAIGNAAYRLGDAHALDEPRRAQFLTRRHVHAQAHANPKIDCTRCWARYLCSGGCHHEAQSRTPASCDFIRAWLDFCLASYCELGAARPEFFFPPRSEHEYGIGHGQAAAS
jgi:uncharacterized protein